MQDQVSIKACCIRCCSQFSASRFIPAALLSQVNMDLEIPIACPLGCLRACEWDRAHKGSWDHSSCHIAADFLLLKAGH